MKKAPITPDEELAICGLAVAGGYEAILSTHDTAVMAGLKNNVPASAQIGGTTLKFIRDLLPKLNGKSMPEAYVILENTTPEEHQEITGSAKKIGRGTPKKAANAFYSICNEAGVYAPAHKDYDKDTIFNSEALLKLIGVPLNGPSMVQATQTLALKMPQQNSGHIN